jgi:Tol biopolymer transport system component
MLAAIVNSVPEPLPDDVPLELRMLVEKALEKEPDDRYQSMRELVVDLRRVSRRSSSEPVDILAMPARAERSARARRAVGFGAGLVATAAVAAFVGTQWLRGPDVAGSPPVPEIRFDVATPLTTDATSLAISPDGQKIVFEATTDVGSQLWLHSLGSMSARPLRGTASGSFPFWAPTSDSVGFFADGKLKRIEVDSGEVRTLANASIGRGGAWNRDGTILFSPGTNDPLLRVSALGGEAVALTKLELTQAGHRFPQFLPDGRHFIYYVTGSPDARGVVVADLQGDAPRRLLDADTGGVFASSGHLFFSRRGALYAQRFDPVRLELDGSAVALPEQVAVDSGIYQLALSASAVGSIVYRSASGAGRQFTWYDRSGAIVGTAGELSTVGGLSPALSPDGRQVAFARSVNGNQDIWLLTVESGDLTRFTFDAAIEFVPLWSPDGSRIVFSSNRSGVFDLYEKPASGAGEEQRLLATDLNKFAVDWSADGESLLYVANHPTMSYDIWALPLGREREPIAIVRTEFEERDAQFSPDGRWIAYQSNDSGRLEVYVQTFPEPGGRWQVSSEGGAQVRWRDDGQELFFLALDGRLMAAPIRLDPKARAIEVGAPTALFMTRLGRGVQTSNRQQYIVAPGGQRFLMNAIPEAAMASALTVVLNWQEAR